MIIQIKKLLGAEVVEISNLHWMCIRLFFPKLHDVKTEVIFILNGFVNHAKEQLNGAVPIIDSSSDQIGKILNSRTHALMIICQHRSISVLFPA